MALTITDPAPLLARQVKACWLTRAKAVTPTQAPGFSCLCAGAASQAHEEPEGGAKHRS